MVDRKDSARVALSNAKFCDRCKQVTLAFRGSCPDGRPEFQCGNCKYRFTQGLLGGMHAVLVPSDALRLLGRLLALFEGCKRDELPSPLREEFEELEVKYPTQLQILEELRGMDA